MRHLALLLGFVCRPALQPALSFLVHSTHLRSSWSRAPRPRQQQQKQQQPFHDTHIAQPHLRFCTATTLAARGSPAFLSDGSVSCYRNLDTGSTAYLVGVIHNARRSSKLVERVIRKVRPQVVMVEVDAHRIRLLPPGEALKGEDGLCWWSPHDERTAAARQVRDEDNHNVPNVGEDDEDHGLNATLKKSVRRRRQKREEPTTHDGTDKDVCEFYTAAVEAVACGARVLLGDRDFEETQRRLLEAERKDKEDRARPLNAKSGDIEMVAARIKRRGLESKPPAVWRKMRDVEKTWRPRKFAVLMTERDQLMADNVMRLDGNQDTVAVVGAHHTIGIGSILEANGWKTRR